MISKKMDGHESNTSRKLNSGVMNKFSFSTTVTEITRCFSFTDRFCIPKEHYRTFTSPKGLKTARRDYLKTKSKAR